MMNGGRGGSGEAQRIHDDQNVATLGGVLRAAPSPGQSYARNWRVLMVLMVVHGETPFGAVSIAHNGSGWQGK
jgi:hypothetical protein